MESKFDYKKFGTTVRNKRKQKKLTQIELAKKIGCGDSSISDIELFNRTVKIDTIISICLWMGASPMDFLLPIK